MPQTPIRVVNPDAPDAETIADAAARLVAGELVAFPTETVYGLGANALDAAAVERIFVAKGRPSMNPVIVHVFNTAAAKALVTKWPATAEKLANAFWPGPLTLVLPKSAAIPDIVTAGSDTVAVRVPDHPVALALLKAAGIPLAAPSANRSTELSPTRAAHVFKSLNGRITLILDGGPCRVGLESTVVDVSGETVRVLRPGMITVPMLKAVIGPVDTLNLETAIARSPGLMAKHYSPRTPVILVDADRDAQAIADELWIQNLNTIILRSDRLPPDASSAKGDPEDYAFYLYSTLHDLDDGRWDRIVIELPPDTPEWAAIRDRLLRMPTC